MGSRGKEKGYFRSPKEEAEAIREEEKVARSKKTKSKKRFGLCYKGGICTWYQTEKSRDQAKEDVRKHCCEYLKKYPQFWDRKKVER